jgi:hypothetical protein
VPTFQDQQNSDESYGFLMVSVLNFRDMSPLYDEFSKATIVTVNSAFFFNFSLSFSAEQMKHFPFVFLVHFFRQLYSNKNNTFV